MVRGPSFSRPPPKAVDPLEKDGIKYEQLLSHSTSENKNRTGWLRATQSATNKELWVKQVYQYDIDSTLELDVQEIYFRSMVFDADATAILIENERGERYSVDLISGESTRQN